MNSDYLKITAAAALVASMSDCEFPRFRTTDKHAPVRGRVVGRDNGKNRKVQPRNAPCECGSGKKAKNCCVYFKQPTN